MGVKEGEEREEWKAGEVRVPVSACFGTCCKE